MNLILQTDSYKVTHWKQYPPGTTRVFSYFESRGGAYKKTLFFGLQYLLYTFLTKPVGMTDVDQAEQFFKEHFGRDYFNRKGWERIVRLHMGYLPLTIRAVDEGTLVPTSNVLMTVENNDPELFWLTNYVETRLVQVWYPTTVATLSHRCREVIKDYLEKTGHDTPDFKLHDFGYRGVGTNEEAGLGGLAHLVNFKGTDTVAALYYARKYYGCHMAGHSVPAAEHSTITSWGKDDEESAYLNMLQQFENGIVAVVSDSYDVYAACEKLWGEVLKEKVLQRKGVLVIRPDSGFPPEVVRKCLEILGNKFGYTVNDKGYKVLDPHVRLIQGDGVDPMMIDMILGNMMTNGWSADNVSFGMGGALLRKVHRDTCKFAFKCSAIEVNGAWRDVYKQPITDTGKQSKPGRLMLYEKGGEFVTATDDDLRYAKYKPMLPIVYRNGAITNTTTLDAVRALALKG